MQASTGVAAGMKGGRMEAIVGCSGSSLLAWTGMQLWPAELALRTTELLLSSPKAILEIMCVKRQVFVGRQVL
jgi:hypothetical protein